MPHFVCKSQVFCTSSSILTHYWTLSTHCFVYFISRLKKKEHAVVEGLQNYGWRLQFVLLRVPVEDNAQRLASAVFVVERPVVVSATHCSRTHRRIAEQIVDVQVPTS